MKNKPPLRTIWLARHGARQDSMYPGWRHTAERPDDTPLAKEGHQQARETGQFLRQQGGVDVIYTSPFLRAVETAGNVAEILDVPIRIEPGLCEVLNPDWFQTKPECLSPADLAERYPWIELHYVPRVHPTYPEYEARGDVNERCRKTVHALLEDTWERSLWVGHGASVGGVAWALTGHTEHVCCQLCGLTGWKGTPNHWQPIYSGVDHLSITEDTLKG